MILISDIEAYTLALQQAVPEISKLYQSVVDDSQLGKFLGEHKSTDNPFLVPFVPSVNIEGMNSDDAQPRNSLLFLILRKADRTQKHPEFVADMNDLQQVVVSVLRKIVADRNPTDAICGFMRQLQVASISVDPVWGLNGCDGWQIQFNLKSSLW